MLIKVEAINIYDFVDDADNLSAIRGGGLMLLEMPAKFGEWLRRQGEVKRLTEGASKAVFRFTPRDGSLDVRKAGREWLTQEYPHATVGLAVLEKESGRFFTDDEALTSEIRTQQMRSFSVAGLPVREGPGVCEWDHVRPATVERIAKDSRVVLSRSTAERFDHGRTQKRAFLHEHAEIRGEWEYTWDMDELSNWPEAGRLHHKVAVFYADGNSFTKMLRQALDKTPPERQEQVIDDFDKHLQGKRKEFLAALQEGTSEPHWQTEAGARRVEVLLWGGDELMLVVPAWCGWETAELFCAVMAGADYRKHGVEIRIRHGMGIIYAHHKAPIHALRSLVRDLAEESKTDRERNRLSYLVLESFDHVGENLKQFRASRRQAGIDLALCADGKALEQMRLTLKEMKEAEFPRRKVFQAAMGLARGQGWNELRGDIEPFLQREGWRRPLEKWRQLAGEGAAAWFHLAELWDYVGLE